MQDLISRQAAIDAICEDGTQLERQGQYSMTMAERKQRDADILDALPSVQPYTDAEIQTMQDLEQAELDKAFELGKEEGRKEVPHWIPCSERMPENRVCVIICYREWQQYAKRYIYSIVIGWYARKHSVRENVFNEWEADCDYDEDEDEFYIHEGWYEFTTQGNADLMNWYINAEVVAWMPLPEPWKGEQQ